MASVKLCGHFAVLVQFLLLTANQEPVPPLPASGKHHRAYLEAGKEEVLVPEGLFC